MTDAPIRGYLDIAQPVYDALVQQLGPGGASIVAGVLVDWYCAPRGCWYLRAAEA